MTTAEESVEGRPAGPPAPDDGGLPSGTHGPTPGHHRQVEAALFSRRDVRRAAWRASPGVVLFIVVAVLGAAAAGVGVGSGHLSPESSPEYESVAAGGLMTLAGIVPAVLAAVGVGRPVTRLDGGQLMLRGLAGSVVAVYCLVWVAAFVLPLLALVEAWAWLDTPAGIGLGLGLLVLSTLGTPIVFLVLAARLNPRHSTLLAVGRATDRAGTSRTSVVRDRGDLVKDLRDLAMTEHEAGDRRAVRYRMAGLATIAARAQDPDVAHLALDELGLVCQSVVRDRDLAREGVALLRLVVDAVPPTAERLLSRVVDEAADIWGAAAREGASQQVTEEAAGVAIDASLRCGPEPLPALAALLQEMGEASGRARVHAVQQICLVDRSIDGAPRVDVVHLPARHPVATAWIETNWRLGTHGFAPLVRRIDAGTNGGEPPRSVRSVITAAADIVLSHTSGISLGDGLRADVKALVREGCTPALRRVAAAALAVEHDIEDAARGVLLAELVRNWSSMSADDLDGVVETVLTSNNDMLLDRCAPALLPRLDTLVHPSLGKTEDSRVVDFPVPLQSAVVRVLCRLRAAAVARDPSLTSTPTMLDRVFARLVDASLAGALTPETDLLLRKRTAAVAHLLDEKGAQETAGLFALPLLPVLLASEGDYGPAWLMWWHRHGGARPPVRPTPAWSAGLTVALLALRVHSGAHEPTAPLEPPAVSPLAGQGWTHGDVVEVAAATLVQLQTDLPSVVLGQVFTEVRRWVDAADDTGTGRTAGGLRPTRLAEALRSVPSLAPDDVRAGVLRRHRRALTLQG